MKLAKRKYKALKPNMAKMLEVYKINGSSGAIAKIAGMESTAKIKSVNSITATTTNNGVASFIPFSTVKNLAPSNSLLTLKNL
ncbi:hypothetical protein D3C85_1131380 [compost metagenome]